MAARTRTCTWIARSPPTRWNSPSCKTRSNLACELACKSPTSSRNRVPLSANSNLPRRRAVAPVKEPFSWPNNSLSIRSFGIAAQFTLTKGPWAKGLSRWMWAAINSLPVPDSPISNTRASLRAASVAWSSTCRKAGELPTIFGPAPICSLRRRFSSRRERCSSAFETPSKTRSRASGFSRKSKAPARVASTASAIVPWPEIMITGALEPSWRRLRSKSIPLPSGRRTSSK